MSSACAHSEALRADLVSAPPYTYHILPQTCGGNVLTLVVGRNFCIGEVQILVQRVVRDK